MRARAVADRSTHAPVAQDSLGHRAQVVLESHDAPGGAAHEWNVKGYHFESGPSLYAGLSPAASPNPLKHVFQIIGEEPEWITYDRWGTYLPDGDFAAAVGAAALSSDPLAAPQLAPCASSARTWRL